MLASVLSSTVIPSMSGKAGVGSCGGEAIALSTRTGPGGQGGKDGSPQEHAPEAAYTVLALLADFVARAGRKRGAGRIFSD